MKKSEIKESVKQKDKVSNSTVYMNNPVVSCRKDKSDLAFLFNPDIDKELPINGTGILIWDFLNEPHNIIDISQYLQTIFSDCPSDDAILSDINQFISNISHDFLIEVDCETN
ncbi:hypothetical protein ACKUB1_16025 [Methanospirillum stamsii]|uniref:PqqD family protein n=1 Tax=Methanospirillum stamsii TaxID=1277351 RepID=A0A2V2MU76_9EURY|nr:hypothetical protein [Methanospirillum stamsii]PWR71744.1 hypothetical protein DLD82_13405 [Methanospirillum stamsii]